MEPFELISSPVEAGFISVIREAQNELFISSPYVKEYGIRTILNNARTNNVRVLTSLDWKNITGLGFDINALLLLWNKFNVTVSSLGNLHAKVYVADNRVAFVTSANLTRGGLKENYEYGVMVRDKQIVSAMLEDMARYFSLGNIFDKTAIDDISIEVEEIINIRKEWEQSAEAKRWRKVLKEKEEALQTKVLTNRTRGKTINAVFAETIEYLLKNRGPLSTTDLHPLIQHIHPDICDDTIDRVIHSQHFGKRWKHLVRNAQLTLKLQGKIELQGMKWHLI